MKALSMPSLFCCTVALAAHSLVPSPLHAQQAEKHLRSKVYVYDLRDRSSHLIYSADQIWEAPNWSPDGKYLILNSGGAIHKLVLKKDGTADTPQKLAIPENYQCNNDKAISPNGKMIAFSASVAPHRGSQVFLANADGRTLG